MKFKRSSGILLHPTSLPGPYGIGDLGFQAYKWIDFLCESGCSWWQILPLGPTGYGDSPYQSFSAFAGNPYLISPDLLLSDSLLEEIDLQNLPEFPDDRVDFGTVISWKIKLFDLAYDRLQNRRDKNLQAEMDDFHVRNAGWLDDFVLFMAMKDDHQGAPWFTWELSLRKRNPEAVKSARTKNNEAVKRQIFRQFLFFRQWDKLHAYASNKGIRIIGDLPIFVAHDSADVWVNASLFCLKKNGQPEFVSGVPPDYFSPTGQLWGNPHYRWKAHRKDGYAWWISRLKMAFSQVDVIRLDHFRGFAGYWEVPGNAKTAEKGRWIKGPGKDLFKTWVKSFGDLPIIAEDLGVITPDVIELRDRFNFPGMKVLQFGLSGDPGNAFLPHHYPENCVVYTGTHDNDTAFGWYARASDKEKEFSREYFNQDGDDISWKLIRACWASVADLAIAPMQDFLSLDNQARMNYPGSSGGNWQWRMADTAITAQLAERIRKINFLYSRTAS